MGMQLHHSGTKKDISLNASCLQLADFLLASLATSYGSFPIAADPGGRNEEVILGSRHDGRSGR
jgi:hypothetical protein